MKKHWRPGSEHDETELVKIWCKLGCKENLRVERDLSVAEMTQVLKEFRQKINSSKPDFITIVILSHGKRDLVTGMEYIMDINWKGFPVNKIKNMFIDGHKCPAMLGRPKFFFLQHCRGKSKQVPTEYLRSFPNIHLDSEAETDGENDDEKMIERDGIRYPHKSWFMSYNSTIEGHVSSRNPAKGSIFMQALCKKLDELWYRADVASIASEVNKEIMENYGQIQAPIYENQLGDKVYFDYLKLSRC